MRPKHISTALAIFAVIGIVNYFQGLAEAQESLIHKVQSDAYSGMTSPAGRPGGMPSQQGSILGDQSRQTGEYKAGSPSTEGRYGSNPSDNYFQKESSERTNSPYGGSVYGGGVPTTPSADPMIKELNRDPSMR
jgi:hypothetical protein